MLKFHELADLFPMITGTARDDLFADVKAKGLRDRIVIHEGQILDGRNRYLAAIAAGIIRADADPEAEAYLYVTHFRRFLPQQDGDPLAWVLSKNLHRRHLSDGQRAMVAARLANMRQGERTDLAEPSANLPKVSNHDAAERLHVSERSVRTAKDVVEHGTPELVEKVERGEVAVSAAAEVAKLPIGEQVRVLQDADPRALARVVRERRQQTQDSKRERRAEREAELGARQAALPDRRYGVILADPEWRFEPYSRDSGMDRAADNHYPTSTTEVIAARPVKDIAAADCALLLWATVPMLPQALEVMAAWGFAYKSHVIWLKDKTGTGYWFRNEHEILLVGTRGNVPAPAMGTQFRSVIGHAVGAHSQKPSFAHEIAEAYWPNLPRIELNAREPREGWDAWGLEAPGEESSAAAADQAGEGVVPASSPAAVAPMAKDQVLEILRKRYTGNNGAAIAAETGRPINTIRKWAFEAGLSSWARNAERMAAINEEKMHGRA